MCRFGQCLLLLKKLCSNLFQRSIILPFEDETDVKLSH